MKWLNFGSEGTSDNVIPLRAPDDVQPPIVLNGIRIARVSTVTFCVVSQLKPMEAQNERCIYIRSNK